MAYQADIAAPSADRLIDEGVAAGLDRARLVALSHLDPDALRDPDRRLPLDRFLDLAAHLIEETGDPLVPVRAVREGPPSRFHVLGFLAMTQADLGSALQAVCRCLAVWVRGVRFECAEVNGDRIVEITVEHELVPVRRNLMCTLAIASLVAHLDQLTDAPLSAEVWLPSGTPQPVIDSFDVPVTGVGCRLKLPARECQRRLSFAQPEMAAFFEDFVHERLCEIEERERILSRLRRRLARALPHGDIRQASSAKSLGMSTRALQRALAEQGTTYRAELAATRRLLALKHLAVHPPLAMELIAWLVGYSDSATFRRAFRKWTDRTPAAYRSSIDAVSW